MAACMSSRNAGTGRARRRCSATKKKGWEETHQSSRVSLQLSSPSRWLQRARAENATAALNRGRDLHAAVAHTCPAAPPQDAACRKTRDDKDHSESGLATMPRRAWIRNLPRSVPAVKQLGREAKKCEGLRL